MKPGKGLARAIWAAPVAESGSQFLAGGACRAATSPSAWSGRNGPPRTAVAPLYAALLVAARRVPPHGDAAPCNSVRCAPVGGDATEFFCFAREAAYFCTRKRTP